LDEKRKAESIQSEYPRFFNLGDETISMTYKYIDDSDDSDSPIAACAIYGFRVCISRQMSIENEEDEVLDFEI
jgi:hypothetical protein